MKAFRTTSGPAPALALVDVDEPVARVGDVVLQVEAVSLNRGELKKVRGSTPGLSLGQDVVGTVVTTVDGGPPVGARAVAVLVSDGLAERVAVPVNQLAVLPPTVESRLAATLPVAGLTALYALDLGRVGPGASVWVTGAAGGVGDIAVQLATSRGARVTATVGSSARGRVLRERHDVRVVVGLPSEDERFDMVLESVGGQSLTRALQVVEPGGVVVSLGRSANEPATIDADWFYRHSGSSLVGLRLFDEMQRRGTGTDDLASLVELVRVGALVPHVSTCLSWQRAAEAVEALWARTVAGKAVLTVDTGAEPAAHGGDGPDHER